MPSTNATLDSKINLLFAPPCCHSGENSLSSKRELAATSLEPMSDSCSCAMLGMIKIGLAGHLNATPLFLKSIDAFLASNATAQSKAVVIPF